MISSTLQVFLTISSSKQLLGFLAVEEIRTAFAVVSQESQVHPNAAKLSYTMMPQTEDYCPPYMMQIAGIQAVCHAVQVFVSQNIVGW